jgi:hypothetical protein
LFFGDSSIAWGLIPKVIEQTTGKKVALYAYESNMLNTETAAVFNLLSEYYLKENGMVILSFDNWTLNKDSVNPPKRRASQKEMYSWNINDMKKFAEKKEISFYNKYLSFHAFKSLYNQKSEYLKSHYGLYLKSPPFYEKYLEPIINLTLHANKSINKNKKTKFIRWDMDTITEYNKNFKYKSIHSKELPIAPMVNKNVELNAIASSKIYGKTKIYMVPLFPTVDSYRISRNMYYSYYKALGFQLADLGDFQPKNHAYTIQAGSHMGNAGGLKKSILIAKWLKQYFNDANMSISSSTNY